MNYSLLYCSIWIFDITTMKNRLEISIFHFLTSLHFSDFCFFFFFTSHLWELLNFFWFWCWKRETNQLGQSLIVSLKDLTGQSTARAGKIHENAADFMSQWPVFSSQTSVSSMLVTIQAFDEDGNSLLTIARHYCSPPGILSQRLGLHTVGLYS